jgi:hypothetical protein
MDCLRGRRAPCAPRHSTFARNSLADFAISWVEVAGPEMSERGLHLVIGETLRILPQAVEPRVKNVQWGDLTRRQFEALDKGADVAVMLDGKGSVTEGTDFNIFSITDGRAATPARGPLDGMRRLPVLVPCEVLVIPCQVRPIPAAELRAATRSLPAPWRAAPCRRPALMAASWAMTGQVQSLPGCALRSGPAAPKAGMRCGWIMAGRSLTFCGRTGLTAPASRRRLLRGGPGNA